MLPGSSYLNPAYQSNPPRETRPTSISLNSFDLSKTSKNNTENHGISPDSGQALIGLGIMCLSTNLPSAFSAILADHMRDHEVPEGMRFILLSMASLFPWVFGLIS
jgi:hypothetical protein